MIGVIGFPSYGSNDKESACDIGGVDQTHMGFILGSGRSPGGGNGYSFQFSCLENPMDRGAWQATVHGVAKSWTRLKQLTHIRILALPLHDIAGVVPGISGKAESVPGVVKRQSQTAAVGGKSG